MYRRSNEPSRRGGLAADVHLRAAGKPALGRTTLRHPDSLPFPHLAAGTDTLPGIEHVVVLMLENHSFDNFFGLLGRGDGFALGANGRPTAVNPYPNGQLQHAFRMPTTCQLSGTPSQEWLTSHTAYDNGKNDGFVRAPISVTDATIVLANDAIPQALLAQVVHALGSSPLWAKTILLVMYDEHGGCYDHVPPPPAIPPGRHPARAPAGRAGRRGIRPLRLPGPAPGRPRPWPPPAIPPPGSPAQPPVRGPSPFPNHHRLRKQSSAPPGPPPEITARSAAR